VFFVQLSDTHVGYHGAANPEADVELARAIDAVNALSTKPAFAVFTGDLSHDVDDAKERRARLTKFKQTIAKLNVSEVHFLPGEHDAAKDHGEAYRDVIGDVRFSFERAGVRFVGLDNATDPKGALGDDQLAWLEHEVNAAKGKGLVVFAHRPLFTLEEQWDWFTADGAKAIAMLQKHGDASVFYGHIHQEHHATTGSIAHHAARSLVFPLPKPFSQEKRLPLPWNAAATDHGLGFRTLRASTSMTTFEDVALSSTTAKPNVTAPADSGW
jgi:3',5'-cyclic AMP phosphodiesterase CpdA